MTVTELRNKLKNGNTAGWYLFCGEESYLKRHYLSEMRRAVLTDPTTEAFNHMVLEGAKIDWAAFESALEAPPMMADQKLVEWHLCDFSAMKEADLTRLREASEVYRSAPDSVTVFVVDADCLDVGNLPKRPSKLYKTLSEIMDVVVFEKSDESSLRGWLSRHFSHNGIEVNGDVLNALLARSGRAMDALSGEVEKLTAYAKAGGRSRLTVEDVAFVASPNGEEEAFGLDNAVIEARPDSAYAALRDARLRRTEPTLLLGAILRIFGDLFTVGAMASDGMSKKEIAAALKKHEYKIGLYMKCAERRGMEDIRRALALCRETDVALKSNTGMNSYLAIEMLLARTIK